MAYDTDAATLTPASAPTATPDIAPARDQLALLTEAVRVATGNDTAQPREGQAALRLDIDKAMGAVTGLRLSEADLQVVGIAPTGSGKSLATLTAAVDAALDRGERSVLSTDSLALMSQLEGKDVPTVLTAVQRLHPGQEIRVAFLKGVSNYVDPARVIASAQELTQTTLVGYATLLTKLREVRDQLPVEEHKRVDLVQWGLSVYLDEDATGDRHSCPIEHTAEDWEAVSAPSARADDGKRYGVTSKARAARERAAEADIVITNHSILAVQAALGIPAILASQNLGGFDHIIVDEAHTLPAHVRSQGAKKLSKSSVVGAARNAFRVAGSPSGGMRGWAEDAERLGDVVGRVLEEFLDAAPRQGGRGPAPTSRRLTEDDNILADYTERVKEWVDTGKAFLAPIGRGSDVSKALKAQAAAERLGAIAEAFTAFGQHRSGWARWVEREQRTPKANAGLAGLSSGYGESTVVANVSPVNVGNLLRQNLWQVQESEMSVTAISATLPGNYPFQAGLDTQVRRYPSPFDVAYSRSALFIPHVSTEAELDAITERAWGNKVKFDVRKHPEWAAAMICDLVLANGGSALVLAAKSDDGRLYADRLRSALRRAGIDGINVHSQWDGGSTQKIVSEWRDDVASVLVGTKSLATGVDNAGESNTLVIIDRVPRSPSNPVDDARVDEIVERNQTDRWTADRAVYVTDASLLLSQAAGRLIRATSDTGMVAVLDPRLLKATGSRPGPITYQEATRQLYMAPLSGFGTKLSSLLAAREWLRERRG